MNEKKNYPFYTQNKTRFDKYLSTRKSLYGIIDRFANIGHGYTHGARMSNAHVYCYIRNALRKTAYKIMPRFFALFLQQPKKKKKKEKCKQKKTVSLRSLILLSQWHLYEQRS